LGGHDLQFVDAFAVGRGPIVQDERRRSVHDADAAAGDRHGYAHGGAPAELAALQLGAGVEVLAVVEDLGLAAPGGDAAVG
jgi:hypothetical protein